MMITSSNQREYDLLIRCVACQYFLRTNMSKHLQSRARSSYTAESNNVLCRSLVQAHS